MDQLPNEIISSLLTYLSQQCTFAICTTVCKQWYKVINQPYFYSTIHIYSKHQFEKFNELPKKNKKINNKPINYYVNRFIFHYKCNLNIIVNLSAFPNLQHIDGLGNDLQAAFTYNPLYFQLKNTTNFFYLHNEKGWILKFNHIKHHLKSLNIFMTLDVLGIDTEQQLESSLDIIYMKSIRNVTEMNFNGLDIIIPVKMLILPTISLANLIKLKIHFVCYTTTISYRERSYNIDEHTFENIHQSCPLLESLLLEDFYMDVSDEYHHNHEKKKILPTYHLKDLNIIQSVLNHPSCIHYFITKYPYLESLSLDLIFKRMASEKKIQFQQSFSNLLLQFPFLNRFSYKHKGRYFNVWSHDDFMEWLNKYPNQLIELDYRFPLINDFKKNDDGTEINNNDVIQKLTIQQQQYHHYHHQLEKHSFLFLNHLTSLSLFINDAMDLVFTFLLSLSDTNSTIIVSSTLEKLKLKKRDDNSIEYIYIYDWLDMFPNLLSFDTDCNVNIRDSSNFYNGLDTKNDMTCHLLHQLIIERKQQNQQHDNLNKKNNDSPFSCSSPSTTTTTITITNATYRLHYLKIASTSSSKIWFENGFDELLNKCQQLKQLVLSNIIFIVPNDDSINEIHFDLSFLHLELLKMNKIYCTTFQPSTLIPITQFNIHDILMDCKRVFKKDDCDKYFNLNIKCKYIDGFSYNFN
ncbi:unnamed protein product [Cunninghamella blakesleeana]